MDDVGYAHDLFFVWIFGYVLNHIKRWLLVTTFSCLVTWHSYCVKICIRATVLREEQDIFISLRKIVSDAAAYVVFLIPDDVFTEDIARLNEHICKTMRDPHLFMLPACITYYYPKTAVLCKQVPTCSKYLRQ